MTKNQRLIFSGCLYVTGFLVAIYGAGFSWRQVIVGSAVLLICQFAGEMFKIAAKQSFTRFQFRIHIDVGRALEEAGLYRNEWDEAMDSIHESMTGKGFVIFTWLEPKLFYMNTTRQFTSRAEAIIELPSFGTRQSKEFELPDIIEMRSARDGYEIVLLTREQRYRWPETTSGKDIVLFNLPYEFFWSLQSDLLNSHKKAKTILTAAGFTYHLFEEGSDVWDYRNEYGSLRWWDV